MQGLGVSCLRVSTPGGSDVVPLWGRGGSTGLVDVLSYQVLPHQLGPSLISIDELGDMPGNDLFLGHVRKQAVRVGDSLKEQLISVHGLEIYW